MWPYGQSTLSREEGTPHIPVCILKAKRNEQKLRGNATAIRPGVPLIKMNVFSKAERG